jgi:hypothetical protein
MQTPSGRMGIADVAGKVHLLRKKWKENALPR